MTSRRTWARVRALWRWFTARRRIEADMHDEFAAHIDMRARDLERTGLTPSEARRQAFLEFGGTERYKEEARRARGWPLVDATIQDVRWSLRSLRRAPGFALAAVLSLALGVGATTALFSVVDATLLRPLPVRAPGRLVDVWAEHPEEGWTRGRLTPAELDAVRERVVALGDAAGYGTGVATISGEDLAEALRTGWVTGGFFDVLGVAAVAGRGFREEETWSGAEPVVIVSEALWARRWGRDPGLVGSTVLVDEVPRRVVGVMPSNVPLPEGGTEVWLPMEWDPTGPGRRWWREERFVYVVARLADGVAAEAAQAELAAVGRALEEEHPDTNRGVQPRLTPLPDALMGAARLPLSLLLASTGLLLLLTCANLANLQLVRATGRRDEIALRSALGAARTRIARQLLAESITLATLSGLVGALLAVAGTQGFLALQPPGAWRVTSAPVDARVLGFSAVLTLACGVLFGLVPILHTLRSRDGRLVRGAGTRAWRPLRRALVVTQVAMSVVLVSGAGLLLRTFVALRTVDPGFEIENRTSISLVLPARYADDADLLAFVDEIAERIGVLPDVAGVAYATRAPFGGASPGTHLTVEGRDRPEAGLLYGQRLVGPEWFRTAGVPVLAGRDFGPEDDVGGEPVVVINQSLARRVFGGESPLGRRLATSDGGTRRTWLRIVGVVGDEHQDGLRAPAQPEVLFAYRWLPSRRITLLVEDRGRGVEAAALRGAIAEVDPTLAPFAVRRLDEVYASVLGPERFLLTLTGGFAFLAMILAALGVYGVAAETAQRRRKEMGIRLALGARPAQAGRLVLAEGLGLSALGIALGIGASWGGSRWMGALLYGVAPRDASTYASAAATVAVVALAACAVPVIRAARLDPSEVIRAE